MEYSAYSLLLIHYYPLTIEELIRKSSWLCLLDLNLNYTWSISSFNILKLYELFRYHRCFGNHLLFYEGFLCISWGEYLGLSLLRIFHYLSYLLFIRFHIWTIPREYSLVIDLIRFVKSFDYIQLCLFYHMKLHWLVFLFFLLLHWIFILFNTILKLFSTIYKSIMVIIIYLHDLQEPFFRKFNCHFYSFFNLIDLFNCHHFIKFCSPILIIKIYMTPFIFSHYDSFFFIIFLLYPYLL